MPVLFLLVTGFLLVSTLMTTPVRALVGLGLIALGLPVYYFLVRPRRVTVEENLADDKN